MKLIYPSGLPGNDAGTAVQVSVGSGAETSLGSAVVATGVQSAQLFARAPLAVQATGSTSAGAGSAVVSIEVSNDGLAYFTAGTISLTLSTTPSTDGFGIAIPWKYVRANVTTLTGTGAAVSVSVNG